MRRSWKRAAFEAPTSSCSSEATSGGSSLGLRPRRSEPVSGVVGLGAAGFTHETINHRAGEYARDGVSTNSIESVWAVLKRGIHGTFHHVSPKHLGRYVDEFTFRLNEGNVERHTLQRLDSFVDGTAGKRLTYKALIR